MPARGWIGVALLFAAAACGAANGARPAADGTVPAPADVAAPPPDALKTPSGLASRMLQVGFGRVHPGPRSQVLVNYTGWTTDGRMFDSSGRTGGPVLVGVDQVIPGWTEGLQLMVPGEKRRFWMPSELAHTADMPGMPEGMLVFDIELLAIR